jgi:KaiC/GvpD/RAD55 family RecA-like ATPase
MTQAKAMGIMTERSYSKKGGHIIFLAKPDPALPKKIDLGNKQEIEIFGHPASSGKSVMLTGDALSGDVIELPMALTDFLMQCGIRPDEIHPKAPPAPPAPQPAAFAPMPAPASFNDEMARAKQALQYIQLAEGDYEKWIEVGMALRSGFAESGFALWAAWSATQPGYVGEPDCLRHWRSFQGAGVGVGTLFHLAAQGGYRPASKAVDRRTAVEDFGRYIQEEPLPPAPGLDDEPAPHDSSPSEPQPPGWPELVFDVNTLEPIDFLIDGFLAHSFSVISGQPGVGKTTAILAVAMIAAGFVVGDSPLRCEARRKIIYVSEDTAQVRRSLYAYCVHFDIPAKEITDWFVLIESRRSDVPYVLELAHNVQRHTVNAERPWLIIDTANATLDIENENDNSEVGSYMAALKQTIFTQLNTSISIITHMNKQISREDDSAMARGASAFTGDATLTAVLFQDETKNRYMKLSKKRYEPLINELRFDTHKFTKPVLNRHGNIQELSCIIVIPQISSEEIRQEMRSDIKNEKRLQAIADKAEEAYSYIHSLINQNPNGVIFKKGSGGHHKPPAALEGHHVLSWADVLSAVPGAADSSIKREVKDAVFARFSAVEVAPTWFKL